MTTLSGKVALVSGSTSGIGLEIARELASAGCQLMVHGIDSADIVENAKAALYSAGAETVICSNADLTDSRQARDLIHQTMDSYGRVDILVNNAGVQHVAPVEEFTDKHWDRILEINLSAPFRLIRQVLPVMRANAWGRIVNIASVHGLVGSRNKSAYIASKHGLVGLTKTVALETATAPITCNAICPGYVRTELMESQIKARAEAENTSIESAAASVLEEKQPSKQFVDASEIGALVSFLCSDASNQITGAVMTIDGGWTAQ